MIEEYKNKTNIGVGAGIVLQILGRVAMLSGGGIGALGSLMVVAGWFLFIWGCCNYAMGKGYHWSVGLLGLLNCLGLIILVFLPNKVGR